MILVSLDSKKLSGFIETTVLTGSTSISIRRAFCRFQKVSAPLKWSDHFKVKIERDKLLSWRPYSTVGPLRSVEYFIENAAHVKQYQELEYPRVVHWSTGFHRRHVSSRVLSTHASSSGTACWCQSTDDKFRGLLTGYSAIVMSQLELESCSIG